jgi:hypothetical protein
VSERLLTETEILEIQENIQDTTAALGQLERALAENPTSRSLGLSGKSLQKRLQVLERKVREGEIMKTRM